MSRIKGFYTRPANTSYIHNAWMIVWSRKNLLLVNLIHLHL